VFGTYDDPGVVTVPRRMAPTWMVDETGELRAEFADDYIVKGIRRAETSAVDSERDRVDAFANIAPEV
jgi:hypothetical protein